jgi:carboxyl-terminal processing protease
MISAVRDRNALRRIALSASIGLTLAVLSQSVEARESGVLFEAVVEVLADGYYDRGFRREELPLLAARYRPAALEAEDRDAERRVIHQFLSHIPASHLALLSTGTYKEFMRALAGEPVPTLGFELVELDGGYFVPAVLEGGPAQLAGLRRGDRVLSIDGVGIDRSPLLDWRSDDAHLPDPPTHRLRCRAGDVIRFEVERQPAEILELEVRAASYSPLDAARASAHVFHLGNSQLAYIHFWFVHARGMHRVLRQALENDFRRADALVLDLRGRGGDAHMIPLVLDLLAGPRSKWNRPVIGLIDERTRSAKEALAFGIRKRGIGVLVGGTTAGAFLPASFKRVGPDSVLMYPAFDLGRSTARIEGSGIRADIPVEDPLPHAAGDDPILRVGLAVALDLAGALAP